MPDLAPAIATPPPPSPRKSERTRAAILKAAQAAFSTRGYAATGVRDITAAAGVNPALVSRYFGSKEQLFEEVLRDALNTSWLTSHAPATFGRDMVAAFAEPEARANPLPMLVLASGDPTAREIAYRLLQQRVMEPLVAWFDTADAEVRAARLMLVSAGFFTYRLLYPLAPLTGELDPRLRQWLEREFQAVVDAPPQN